MHQMNMPVDYRVRLNAGTQYTPKFMNIAELKDCFLWTIWNNLLQELIDNEIVLSIYHPLRRISRQITKPE